MWNVLIMSVLIMSVLIMSGQSIVPLMGKPGTGNDINF